MGSGAHDYRDFTVKGLSIFSRTIPHVPKTLRRISVGFADQSEKTPLAAAYVEAVTRLKRVSEMYHAQIGALPSQKSLGRKLTKAERDETRTVKASAQHQHRLLVEEAFSTPVAVLTWEDILLHESVQPTLEGERRLSLGTMSGLDPVITKLFGTTNAISVNEPLDTIKAGGTTYGLAKPVPDTFLVTVNHGNNSGTENRQPSLDRPLNTITTKNSQGVVSAFCLRANASDTSSWDDAVTNLDTPLRTVTTKNNLSLVLPDATILPQHAYSRDTTATTDVPLPTITTISRHGLVQPTAAAIDPFICSRNSQQKDHNRTHSLDEPTLTATASGAGYLVDPTIEPVEGFIASYYGPRDGRDRAPRNLDQPLATQTTENRFALVDPVLVSQHYGFDNANPSLDEPLLTATTRGAGYVAEPAIARVDPVLLSRTSCNANSPSLDAVIIPQHTGGESGYDKLERPLRAITTQNGTGVAVPVPDTFITPNFSERDTQKPRTHSLDDPLPTTTSHGAGMLVQPDTAMAQSGKPYIIVSGVRLELDVLYRMLNTSELSRAMSFEAGTDKYRFTKSSSTSQRVRMIGNAVAVKTASAIIKHALSYRFDANEVAKEMVAA